MGRGFGGAGSGPDGRRVDDRRQPAAAIRSGRGHGQHAGRAGCDRPVGDDADVPAGRRLLHRHGARVAASRPNGAADPDRGRGRGHAGGGQPGTRRGRLSRAAHRRGVDRVRGAGHLACRGLAARVRRALDPAARRVRGGRRRAVRPRHVVRRRADPGRRAGRAGRTRRGRRAGDMAASGGVVLRRRVAAAAACTANRRRGCRADVPVSGPRRRRPRPRPRLRARSLPRPAPSCGPRAPPGTSRAARRAGTRAAPAARR